jgi:hypothetical protein
MHSTAMMSAVLAIVASGGSVQPPLAQSLLVQHVAQDAPSLSQKSPESSPPPPPATEGRSSIPQAPTGHRQPTQRDLPPDLLRREQSEQQPERPPMRDPYQPPSICRGC